MIKGINKLGTTIIISSHLIDELERNCTRIALLHNSSLIRVGTPDELKSITNQEVVIVRSSPGDYERIAKEIGQHSGLNIKEMTIKDNRLHISTEHGEETLNAVLRIAEKNKEKIIDIEMSKPSLKEIFEILTKSEV